MGCHLRQPYAPAGNGVANSAGMLVLTSGLQETWGSVDDYAPVSMYDVAGSQQGCHGAFVAVGAVQTTTAPTFVNFYDDKGNEFETTWPTTPPTPKQFATFQGTEAGWFFFISLINAVYNGPRVVTVTLSGVPYGNVGALAVYDYYSDSQVTVATPIAQSVNAAGPLSMSLPGSVLNGEAHFLVASSASAVTVPSAGWTRDNTSFGGLLSMGNGRFSTLVEAALPYPQIALQDPASSVSFAWSGSQLVDAVVFQLIP